MPTRMKMDTHPPQLMHASRLIIASNRGPVEFQLSQDNTLKARRGSGGMVTALIDAGNSMEVTWVAMTMTEGDRKAANNAQAHGGLMESPIRGQHMKLHYVAIPKATYRKYYDRISNEVLWFLQHYMYDHAQTSTRTLQDAWSNGYFLANKAIADAVNTEIERETGSAVVMLQDYHLYLAALMIRERHPEIIIQQFIHIPWPDVRCWHFLPIRMVQDIYSGLAGNDIIGFQTERDARNFLDSARTFLEGADVDFEEGILKWRDHCTRARSYPISISVVQERRVVNSAAGRRAAEQIKPLLREHTIMRVDRLEPTKNILRGFQAYEILLEEHPELHGKITFLAFLVPSRQSLPRYRKTAEEVFAAIERINKQYGSEDWMPIHVFYDNDRTRALAAMQFYDVLLVNPIIDGMNLVAKEGPVVNQRNGVLVLSRTAGAFQQLAKGSIPTSPTDVTEMAQALYNALHLPPQERRMKAVLARQAVERNDLNLWMKDQIDDINALLDSSLAPGPEPITEPLPKTVVANVT
jgi:trehalose 6-phosphate synthase